MFPLRDTQPSLGRPFVTSLLIALNVLVFLLEAALPDWELNHVIAHYGIIPTRFQYLDLLTSQFLHGGWMHLISNMWFLWVFGDNVEDVLGHARFLLFYLLCGVGAGLAHVMLNADSRVPTIGASGAIAGVMGAYLVKFPQSRVVTLVFFFFITILELPAFLLLLYWFAIQIFSGVGSIGYSHVSRSGTAWFAHVGGFLVGMALIKLLPTHERFRHRLDLRW